LENSGYLFAVYSVIWAVLFIYVLFLLNGQKKLRKEIEELKRALREKSGGKSE
jgi:CcmD family protein